MNDQVAPRFLKNKHALVALVITPILALIGYFGVDRLLAEAPHSSRAGESYPLVAKPNCRYQSGQCDLENGSLRLSLKPVNENGTIKIRLTSSHPLQSAHYALGDADSQAEPPPLPWTPVGERRKVWTASFDRLPKNQMLRLVVRSRDSLFFGEVGLSFLNYETSFDRDFRSKK